MDIPEGPLAMDALGQAGFARLSIATMPEDGE
jgi:hypothetical protein